MKESVVIEYLDPINMSRVAVLSYDDNVVGSILETCSREEASNNYDIVGELRDGQVIEFDNEDYEDDTYYDSETDDDYED